MQAEVGSNQHYKIDNRNKSQTSKLWPNYTSQYGAGWSILAAQSNQNPIFKYLLYPHRMHCFVTKLMALHPLLLPNATTELLVTAWLTTSRQQEWGPSGRLGLYTGCLPGTQTLLGGLHKTGSQLILTSSQTARLGTQPSTPVKKHGSPLSQDQSSSPFLFLSASSLSTSLASHLNLICNPNSCFPNNPTPSNGTMYSSDSIYGLFLQTIWIRDV